MNLTNALWALLQIAAGLGLTLLVIVLLALIATVTTAMIQTVAKARREREAPPALDAAADASIFSSSNPSDRFRENPYFGGDHAD
ncbi:hypothetical protein [Trueperella sp. HMSC08H06]|uniref:hypothetical protein n=1 Tax=Trueperella sp. HMSC08H06 TaxID=1581142 RepID=UPI0008A5F513|nr:hypothetical protein [Trueperella sp. HMSC08H06]OFS67529.1 hypothetical protein HMPREF3174_03635 [Trueperella sp. HMSC08H06]